MNSTVLVRVPLCRQECALASMMVPTQPFKGWNYILLLLHGTLCWCSEVCSCTKRGCCSALAKIDDPMAMHKPSFLLEESKHFTLRVFLNWFIFAWERNRSHLLWFKGCGLFLLSFNLGKEKKTWPSIMSWGCFCFHTKVTKTKLAMVANMYKKI